MKVLISTFAEGDAKKIQTAMRAISYEKLVLVGEKGADSSDDFGKLQNIESMAGDQAIFESVDTTDFLEMVDRLCEIIKRNGPRNICINIAGGSKLLGDAALFAAFRMGSQAQYIGEKSVRLPIIVGASAEALLTPLQKDVLISVNRNSSFNTILESTGMRNGKALERMLRELRKMDLVHMDLRSGTVHYLLTQHGHDLIKWMPEEAASEDND